MSGVSSLGGAVPSFIAQLGEVAEEVTGGAWNDREEALSAKINDLIQDNQSFLADPTKEASSHEAFTVSILKLVDALNVMDSKTEKVAVSIQQLGGILQSELESANTDLKHLPSNTEGEIKISVDNFRGLIKADKPGAKESFAEWIDFSGVSLSQLNLSKEELLEIAPHLTFLDFDVDNFSEGEVHDIISKCDNLNMLVLKTDSITTTPQLPESLKIFNLKFNPNLEEVSPLNEGLREFNCSSNEGLSKLPAALPQNLLRFSCVDNPHVKTLPTFNEGLRVVNCSGSRVDEVPALPKSLMRVNFSECYLLKNIGALPPGSNLIDLDVSRCDVLENIPQPLPKGMKTLTISWCPELKLPDNFEAEKPSSLTVVK